MEKAKDTIWFKTEPLFRPGYAVVYPGDGSDPYIEFKWRENETPKRYKLEILIEKLAEMGILQECDSQIDEDAPLVFDSSIYDVKERKA
jgi:hypothetical protein